MALSGSVNTDKYDGRYYQVSWTATQSVTNNQSTIKWTLKALGGNSSWYAERTLKVVVAGKTVYSKTASKERYTGTIDSGTVTVNHNSDGTKSFSINVQAAVYTSSVNCKGSDTFTLNTIARASSITSATNTTLGNPCTIKWTPKSTSFYYKIKLVIGSWNWTSGALHPNKTTEYSYATPNLSLDIANKIPNSATGTLTVYLYTYSNSACTSQVGSTASKSITVTVPSSIIPTLSSMDISIVNENDVVNSWGVCVKGYSKIKVKCSAKGAYSSTIKSFILSGGYSANVDVDNMPYTGSVINSSGTINFECVAKDSRSRTSKKSSVSQVVYNYYLPNITEFKVERDISNAKKIVALVNYSFASVNGNNSAKATIYYKEADSNKWLEYGEIKKGVLVSLDAVSFEETKSYNFKVVVEDLLSDPNKPISLSASVSTIQVLMDFRAGGKGLGIGKICESDSLEVGFEANFKDNVNIDGKITANNIGRTLYSGMDFIKDTGLLSTATTGHIIRFYLLKPFNLVYIRMYVDGLKSDISASNDYTTLCTVDDRFKPPSGISLSATARNGCDAVINASGEIRIIPRGGLSTSSTIYISGILPLNSDSSLYE